MKEAEQASHNILLTVFVITLRVGWNWKGVLKLEPNNGDQAGTQLLEQRYV